MPSELRDNAEARAIRPTGSEPVSLVPSQQDMAAFWQSLKQAGAIATREQEMFSTGYTFGNLESLYGGSGAGNVVDNYLTEKGTIGRVTLAGTSPMSELKAKDQGDRQAGQQPEKLTLNTPEGQQVRNAGGEHIEAIKAANPNASDGSVKNWAQKTPAEKLAYAEQTGQDRSFELVDRKPSGKEVVIAARQMFAEVETKSASKPQVQELAEVASRSIKQPEQGKTETGKPLENTPEGWLAAGQKIAQLPLEQQMHVIGNVLVAGIQQHQQTERERALGGLIGTVQGVGHVAENLAKIADFGAALILGNDERAGAMAAECGTALGQSIVGGVRLFQATQQYSYDVGYTGDYGKPFRDIAAVGNALNEHWSQLPPREQERVKYKFITEMVADGAIGLGAGQAIGKAKTFTEVLDAVAENAATHGGKALEATKKAVKTIGETVDGLMAPEYAMPGGSKMKWHNVSETQENVMFMKGDKGLPQGIKPSEHVSLSERMNSIGYVRPEIDVPKSVYEAAAIQGFSKEVVDHKLQIVAEALQKSFTRVGKYDPLIHGTERTYGNLLHEQMRQNLLNVGDKAIHPEASYLRKSPAEWGKLGTSRVDITIGDKAKPFVSLCLKTLKATPSAQQERGWVRNLPSLDDGSVPPRLYLKIAKPGE